MWGEWAAPRPFVTQSILLSTFTEPTPTSRRYHLGEQQPNAFTFLIKTLNKIKTKLWRLIQFHWQTESYTVTESYSQSTTCYGKSLVKINCKANEFIEAFRSYRTASLFAVCAPNTPLNSLFKQYILKLIYTCSLIQKL